MASQTATLEELKEWYRKCDWKWEGGRKQKPQDRPGQDSTMVGPQPCCVPALLLLQPCKGANAVCITDCSVTALMLISPFYTLERKGLQETSDASKSTWQGICTTKSESQQPPVSTVLLLAKLFKLVNTQVVSAGA